MIVDLNNLVFAVRFAKIKTPTSRQRRESYVTELIFKETLAMIVRYANELKSDAIAIACDSSNVWRKDIYPEYKANRDHADIYYDEIIEAANLTKKFFKTCTNVAVFDVPRAEADDIIAVMCQESRRGVENIILSSDKDFVQLLNDTTKLFSPIQRDWRRTENAKYDLFVKCIRGDSGDNIRSAYPRVRETKLQKAWDDPYTMANLMETVRKDGEKVAIDYYRNSQLIDLSLQPQHLRNEIFSAISSPNQRKFGELKIMAFLGEHNLKKFSGMLQFKEKPLKGLYRLNN
jgi:5'-3' exonuclease